MNDRLLLVIPCFRESGRVGSFLAALCSEFSVDDGVSILLVEDGSGDEEAARMHEIVETCRADHAFLRPLLKLQVNLGKGGAVYAGWAANQGERWLAFVDADGSVSAGEVARVIDIARKTGASVFASRMAASGHHVQRTWHRRLIGRVFAWVVSAMVGVPVRDSQCGFKIVSREAFDAVSSRLVVKRYAFDVELLVALSAGGHPVREEPVDWHDAPGAKIRLVRDSWRMFRDVLQIRRRKKLGLYQP